MRQLRRFLLLGVFLLGSRSVLAQREGAGYAVTAAGDTIPLRASSWIAVHRHPHILTYRDAAGKKHRLPAGHFAAVYLPVSARAFAQADGPAFVSRPLLTKKGRYCHHFLQEICRAGPVFYRSVSCSRCQRLSLYLQRGDGPVEFIGQHNYSRVLQEALPQRPAVVAEAGRRAYDAGRVEKVLRTLR